MRLVTAEPRLLDAAVESDEALAEAVGVPVTPGWNSFPQALARVRDNVSVNGDKGNGFKWGTLFFVADLADSGAALVGWGGFKGPPTDDGQVELGYEIAERERGRGLATDAVRSMLEVAWAAPEVRSVIAHTLAEPGPSVRVLEKCGFTHEAELEGDESGPVWRFRLRR